MPLQQDVGHVGRRLGHGVARCRLDHDGVHDVEPAGEDVLRGGDRDEDLIVAAEAERAALRLEDADDLEVDDARPLLALTLRSAAEDLAQLQRLAHGVRLAEEVGRGRRADDRDRRVHSEVRAREEVAALQIPVAHDRVVLGHSVDVGVPVLAGGGHLPAAGALLSLDRGDARAELGLERAHVVEREVLRLRARALQTTLALVRRRDGDEVRAQREDGVLHLLRRAVADGDHRDHRRDADDHAEHRERRTQLVHHERLQRGAE